ncbi:COP9 signalosome complex subunit 8 [Phytophthora citrophthora]|uniref:Voltage-gated hydrogen channel 1 n=1 Tax=Phytophthora citrophthora TaxID=4793 RepID=A0AAD9LQT5_9STRA|nr:COP9 signalosome complex subunit 8 [Phytophthora citrophthora]
MDNLVDTLTTQREELLAAHASASDHETAHQLVQQLKVLSQELELVAEAATLSQPSVLSPDFYASYLLVVLLAKDLNDARFLWKRIPNEMKQTHEELRNVWEVGKALWQRNLAAAYVAMDYDWSPSLQGLVEALKTSTRENAAELLSISYSTVSINDVALALGFSRHEDAQHLMSVLFDCCADCSSLGWEVSTADQLILPKPLANVRRGPSTVVDLDQLDTLSKTVLHLEQNTDTLLMEKPKARRKTGELKSTARGVASDAESTVSTRSSNSSTSSRSWKQKQRQLKTDAVKQVEGDEDVAQFKSLGAVLETTEVQVTMIVLIALDVGCTAVGIHLNDQQQLNSKCSATEEVTTSLLLQIVTGLVESFTGFTLFLFLIEQAILLAAFRRKFFSHAGYVLDLVVVSLSIAVELYAQTKAARLLGVLRVWRVLRIVRRLVDQERSAHDTTRDLLEQEQLKLLHVRMQKDAAHESLKLEYESRAGLERLLRGYKDEIVTLKEALQIAAQAVAEAGMTDSSSAEPRIVEDVVRESSVGSYPVEEAAVHPADLTETQYWEGQEGEYRHQEADLVQAHEEEMDLHQEMLILTEEQSEEQSEVKEGNWQSESEFEDAVDE